jgi:hypothetical protein
MMEKYIKLTLILLITQDDFGYAMEEHGKLG